MTALRFFAAFAVLGFHAVVADPVLPSGSLADGLRFLFNGGATGVCFFFVLSGFVLAWTARSTDPARRFWRRRFARVYPNHIITWAVVLAALVAQHKQVSAAAAAATAGLVQAWVPAEKIYFGVNTPSWSLSCEAFFYLLFPLLFRLISRLDPRGLRRLALLSALVPSVLAAATYVLPSSIAYWFIFVFPPSRLTEFVLGIVLARLIRIDALPRIPVVPAMVLALVALVVAGHVPWQWGFASVAIVPAALLICATAQRDVSGAGAALLHRGWLITLGETSFALYLVHQIVLRAVPHSPSVGKATVILLLACAASIGWALGMHRYVEVPLYRRLSNRSGGPGSRDRESMTGPVAATPPVAVVD